ncbi:hypothetical protein [uncultured Sphingomonas sp.]|nr:hypothetical protein [uncultured Sphingomonas sp.]
MPEPVPHEKILAVVARQLRHWPAADALELVEQLRAEVAIKPGQSVGLGF